MKTNEKNLKQDQTPLINKQDKDVDQPQTGKQKREELQKQDPVLKEKEDISPLEKPLGYQPDSNKNSSDVEAELKARIEQEKEEKDDQNVEGSE